MILSDPVAERGVLSGICQHGSKVFYDIIDLVQESTFTIDENIIIFRCLKHIFEQDDNAIIDLPLIHAASMELNLHNILSQNQPSKHLYGIFHLQTEQTNIRKFATKIRKLEIARRLHQQLNQAQDHLLNIQGTESISHILGLAENAVFDFIASLGDNNDGPQLLGKKALEYVQHLADNPVQQIGISTGFPVYDQAIGGGLRKATINVIAARPKVGKTFLAGNIGFHVAYKLKLPVMIMDTEMTEDDHIPRMAGLMTRTSITNIETGKFAENPDIKQRVFNAMNHLSKIPFFYERIGHKSFEEQIAIMRRWIIKDVKTNTDGTAKDCVIIYDYLKLTNQQDLSKNLQEYQLLGFMMTQLHNFAVKYKVPILTFIQINRDGIKKESTDVVSGSDRIIWLCSNFTIFKEKSDEEIAEDGLDNGNRKLVPVVTRHGAGLDYRDYINCHMKAWCGHIKEGKTKFELQNTTSIKNEGFVVDDKSNKIPFNKPK